MSTAPVVPSNPALMAWRSWKLIDDPLALLVDLAEKHGRTFVLELFDGPNLITGDPALIADIFASPEDVIDAPNAVVEPLVGNGSVVLASGAKHRRKRKLLMPPFHGARMRAYGEIVREAALHGVASLRAGSPTELRNVVHRVSLEVIVRAVFGVRDTKRIETYREAIDDTVNGLPAWLLFTPPLQRPMGGVGPWSRYRRRLDRLMSMLRDELAAAKAADPAGREDILSLLLSARDEDGQPMPDEEILDELRALVIAGYETTATTLGWALWAVYRHPEVLARLRDELARASTAEELTKLPYLGAVCDETLRRWPIVPIMRRRAVQTCTIGDVTVPAGMYIAPAPLITHVDPELYPDPLAFRPERFLSRKYTPSEFYAFGGGLRRCIGAALANFELRVALGSIVREHAFSSLSDPEPRLVMNGITMRAQKPLQLRYDGPMVSTKAA